MRSQKGTEERKERRHAAPRTRRREREANFPWRARRRTDPPILRTVPPWTTAARKARLSTTTAVHSHRSRSMGVTMGIKSGGFAGCIFTHPANQPGGARRLWVGLTNGHTQTARNPQSLAPILLQPAIAMGNAGCPCPAVGRAGDLSPAMGRAAVRHGLPPGPNDDTIGNAVRPC